MPRPSLKYKILDAAADLIEAEGAQKFTLEAVAERAEVSKGGLLYHFPSKEALMEGLIWRLIDTLEEQEKEIAAGLEDGASDAMIQVISRLRTARHFRENQKYNHALLAAAVTHKQIVEQTRHKFLEKARRVADDPEAMILLLAAEGLVFVETLLMTREEGQEIFDRDPLDVMIERAEAGLRKGDAS